MNLLDHTCDKGLIQDTLIAVTSVPELGNPVVKFGIKPRHTDGSDLSP